MKYDFNDDKRFLKQLFFKGYIEIRTGTELFS